MKDAAQIAVQKAISTANKQDGEGKAQKARERAAQARAGRAVRSFGGRTSGGQVKFKKAGGGQKFYASARVKKIKDRSGLIHIERHNGRDPNFVTENVDKSRINLNRTLIGDPSISISDAVQQFIKASGQKPRKNGVIASEMLLISSPGYFKEGGAQEQRDRLEAWIAENIKYLEDQFGAQVVRADLHMDEATPHIHVVLAHTPSGPMSYAQTFGGSRDAFRQLQTGYSGSLAHLGFERGEPKDGKTPASTLAEFYGKMNEPLPVAPRVTPPPAGPRPEVTSLQALGLASDTESQIKWDRQMQAHQKSKSDHEKWMVSHIGEYHKRAQLAELTKLQASRVVESYRQKESEFDRVKRIADQVRDVDLVEVLKKLGATESASSKEGHKSREFILDGQKIGITGELFVMQGSREGGRGAVNLMMKLESSSFKDSVQRLAEMFGEDQAVTALAAHRVETAKVDLKSILQEPPTLPARDESKTAQVRSYLVDVRGIPEYWADHFLSGGAVYADKNGNAVIPRAQGGAFIRGTVGGRSNKFKRTLGAASLGGLDLPGTDGKLIICEGAFDALALRTMHPESRIIATGGNLIDLNGAEIAAAVAAATEVKAAFDNDLQGRQFAADLKKIYGRKVVEMLPPDENMDWSEKLRLNPQFSQRAPGQPEYAEVQQYEQKQGMTL